MEDNPRAVVGGNNPPPDPKPDRTFKKRWAYALFSRPDKPAGAVAMGFKLYMEMDSQGRGATISDAEFQVSCGVSDGSCRVFKRWLVNSGFIQILVRGRRGYRSEFLATIPEDEIAAADAASNSEYRHPIPVENHEKPQIQPATTAAIPENGGASRARIEPPSGVNISLDNNKLASSGDNPARGLAGLNGSADPMISDIVGWMYGGDEKAARNWLSAMVSQMGQDTVRKSYLKLKTDLAEGALIAKPLQTWTKIAQRLKAEPAAQSGNGAVAETRRDRIRKHIEEAQAKKGVRPS